MYIVVFCLLQRGVSCRRGLEWRQTELSSVGRALDCRSKGRWFNSGSSDSFSFSFDCFRVVFFCEVEGSVREQMGVIAKMNGGLTEVL